MDKKSFDIVLDEIKKVKKMFILFFYFIWMTISTEYSNFLSLY